MIVRSHVDALALVEAQLGQPAGVVAASLGGSDWTAPVLSDSGAVHIQLDQFLSNDLERMWEQKCTVVVESLVAADVLHSRVTAMADGEWQVAYSHEEQTIMCTEFNVASIQFTAWPKDPPFPAFLTTTVSGFSEQQAAGWLHDPLQGLGVGGTTRMVSIRAGLNLDGEIEGKVSQSWAVADAHTVLGQLVSGPPAGWSSQSGIEETDAGPRGWLRHDETGARLVLQLTHFNPTAPALLADLER